MNLPRNYTVGGQGELILLVDDEPAIREMLRRLLEARGFRAIGTECAFKGLSIYRECRDEIRAIITDLRMPRMHGLQFIEELRLINPQVRIVVMSGDVGLHDTPPDEPGRLAYLPKPMTSAELVRALQSVMEEC